MLRAAQDLTADLWDDRAWHHAGDLAWNVATAPDPGEIRVAGRAWAWLQPSGELYVQGDDPGGLDELLAWADGDELVAAAADHDRPVVEALRRAGFVEAPDLPFDLIVHRPPVPAAPVLAAGYRFASADELAPDVLVEVHRRSWRPADLPFADGRAFPPDAQSGFTRARLERVQATWPYRPDLHVVALAADGEGAASCIAWLDERTGAAAVEPLGTHVDHRRRGLAVAVCLEAVRRAGATATTMIHPRGDDAYPVPRHVYGRCGFLAVGRTRAYRRGRSSTS